MFNAGWPFRKGRDQHYLKSISRLYKIEDKIGSVARVPPYFAPREPIVLVRFEQDPQTPARGANGFCLRTAGGGGRTRRRRFRWPD